jgi:zinc protease
MNAYNTLESPKSRAENVQRVVTPSGVEAWLVESYAVPLVALEFSLRGGGAQDPAGKDGLTTMLAGLLDEGAGPYDSSAFHRAVEDLAVHIGFGADRDAISGHFQTLTRNADKAFDLLKLAVNDPRFDQESVDRVRGQLSAGIRRDANDPDAMVAKAFREAAFPDHPYSRATRGEIETLEKVAHDDLEAMRARVFAKKNLKIAVVGAIDAATLAARLDDIFGGWRETPDLIAIPDIVAQNVGQRRIIDLDVPQTTMRFGRPGMAKADPDYFAAVVANHILGGGVFTARLFNEVREKRGLAYSVFSQLHEFDHCPTLLGGAGTKNDRAKETLEVIEEQCRLLASEGPTEDELDKARKYLTGSYALRFDTSTKIASQLVSLQLDGREPSFLDERNRRIEVVTLEDARRAASRLLGDGKLLVAMAGRPVGIA